MEDIGFSRMSVDFANAAGLIGGMSRRTLAPLIWLLLSALPAQAMTGGAAPAAEDLARHLVMIVGSRGNLCTGTALARDMVLTAAHCVAPPARYQVIAFQGAAPIGIRAVLLHPRYDPQSYARHRATADVALLKLAAPLPAAIAPAALGPARPSVVVGERLVVAGFGVTRPGSDAGLGVARAATLIVTGRPGTLQIRLQDRDTRNARAGLGACTGDSGAPVFAPRGQRALIGVVSWSTGPHMAAGCGGLTGVTPLLRYRDWIVKTLRLPR
jgi:secreted trypsin-like serine protease